MFVPKGPSWIVLLAALLVCCEFQPSGDHFVELPQTDTNDMSIDLAAVNNDTLFLYTRTVLSYKSIIGTKRVKYVRAILDDKTLASSKTGDGTFTIEAKYMKNGFYTLTLEIHASSATGSLADVRDKEDLYVSRIWTVAVDNSRPDPVAITTIQRKDGTLEIHWDRYKKFNFAKYQIWKHPYNQAYGYYENRLIKEITDINTTSLVDTTFVGGKVKYSIYVETDGQQSDRREKEFEDPLELDIKTAWLDKSRVRITWRKTPYYKNFSAYEVNFSPNDNDARLVTKNNVNDTSVVIDNLSLAFPVYKNISVSAYPRGVNRGWAGYVYQYVQLTLGEPFPFFTYPHIIYNAALNKYFALTVYDKTLIRVDGTTQAQEQSATITDDRFVLSDNGQHFYITDGDLLKKLDPLTFEVTKTFDLSPYKKGTAPWRISVSNNDVVAASHQYAGSFIFDMATNTLVQQLPSAFYTKLSASGKYMLGGDKIWQWNGAQFAEAVAYGATNWWSLVFKGDEKLVIAYYGTIKVMDLATFTFERSFASRTYEIMYDPVSDLLSGPDKDSQSGMYLYYMGQDTPVPPFNSYHTVVLNNRLISSGRYLPLSYHIPE